MKGDTLFFESRFSRLKLPEGSFDCKKEEEELPDEK